MRLAFWRYRTRLSKKDILVQIRHYAYLAMTREKDTNMKVSQLLDEFVAFAPALKATLDTAATVIPQLSSAAELAPEAEAAWNAIKTAHDAFAAVMQQHAPPA